MLAERLAHAIDARTAAVLVSSVLFETAEIVPGLDLVAAAATCAGAALLVDAYHHLNVVPFDIRAVRLDDAFITGGGYKYCQLGEGNCFLRVPPWTTMRPVLTGWFAEFESLTERHGAGRVPYARGARAFMGATYDPTSHYRAAAVFDFHTQQGLMPERLRAISMRQTEMLVREFQALDVPPERARLIDMPADRRGGFVALQVEDAAGLVKALRTRGVFVDARGTTLRMGPAPYVSDVQLRDAIAALGESLK
jgi:kynureninase